MKKQIVTVEEVERIEDEASAAKYFLEHKRFKFIRDFLEKNTQEIEEKILNNTIREVREEKLTETLRRVFITPKKVQVDELSGMYKFIGQFKGFLTQVKNLPEQLHEAEESGRVIVEKSKENE